jgi:peptide chain release factor 1
MTAIGNEMILSKLKQVEKHFKEIEKKLSDPEIISNNKESSRLNKEYKNLQPIIVAFQSYTNIISNIETNKEILETEDDAELQEMAKDELETLSSQLEETEQELKILLLPKDPEDDKNAIIEIRAGTGGDEASLFAGELYRMYQKFCEQKKIKMEVTHFTEGTVGGFKEIVANITGDGAYGILKYESGVHRVQRVPQTETQGRVHTSAASVVVFPEAEDFDVELRQEDIRKDTYCSSGPGGQSVNTTYSAIRLTHIPTGLVVTCQDEKSQIKNLDKAMKELRARLYKIELEKKQAEEAAQRKSMVSTGDRSAKIRTYNFPQGRITDHRINYTAYNLQDFMNGALDELIEKLRMAENAERLNASGL